MSVSSLPEWKQLLLEKKRREEEARERREKEEEEKFASMPAWKRGIIERRKAKQEVLGDRDKDRDASCLLQAADVRCLSDGLSDTDSSVTVNLGSEPSLSPDPGLWLDAGSQVSLETIVPVHENPFIRTQSTWRKGRDAEAGYQERAVEAEVKEKDKDKPAPRGHDGESWRGRDIERKIERFRDLSEGREKERSRDRSRDRSQGRERESNREAWDKERGRDAGRDAETPKEEKDAETPGSYSPLVPCLRTIRADNIIIIEQDRKASDERRGSRWREPERERPEEEHQGKRGVKMDLREILAGGGSVTEIRASEVLIIKPPASAEGGGKCEKEDGEAKGAADGRRESAGRELRTDVSWLREKEMAREKERPCGQATVIKEDRKDSWDDNVFVERGGRVSQLLSKFGEHPKPPSRSKSSDNFLRPGRRKYSGDHDDQQTEERKADLSKSVPKRSLSFSDRVVSGKENGLDEYYETQAWERLHPERSAAPWADLAGLGRDAPAKIKLGCARLLDRGRGGKPMADPFDRRAAEKAADADGDEGFTVASVKNTEGISFARRVPIRQDGRAREARRQAGDKEGEVAGRQAEARPGDRKVHELHGEGESPPSAEAPIAREAPADCSGLLSSEADKGAEWNGPGSQSPYLPHSVLSQQTEDLISKIEKLGESSVYSGERGAYRAAKDSKQEAPAYGEASAHGATPRSPKRIAPIGIPPGPLDIQIPRTVFYVAEEMTGSKKAGGQSGEAPNQEGGRGVERRDSWRIGKPLSRVESLREKIRQKELERLRQREGADGGGDDGSGAGEGGDPPTPEDELEAGEPAAEWEAAAARKRTPEGERLQEDAAEQTSAAAFDVTQEASLSKTCPPLPVSAPHSDAVRGEELTFGFTSAAAAATASEAARDSFQSSDDEDDGGDDDPLQHAEERLRQHGSRHRGDEGESEEEERELSGEEEAEYTSALEPSDSLSPSPPHPASLAAMSRIYNLETVGSRSALCLRERTMDLSSVHLVQVKPRAPQEDGKAGEDVCGVPAIQRQIEHFQLREQEEAKGGKGAARAKDEVTAPAQETSDSDPPQRVCSPTSQPRPPVHPTAATNTSFPRSRSPDKSLRPSESAPTPASSPSTPSPGQSPSISPSPPLFSIRSAAGGPVKRGTTITVTPKKPVGAGGGGGGGRATASAPTKAPQQQQQAAGAAAEPARKKYPGVEEIQVIGGYQSLEKSCLVKSKGNSKRGKVCFDEEQLEQVCEYPSETSMLACTPFPHEPRPQREETQGQEDEPASKGSRHVGTSTGRGLRVDES